MCSDRYHGGELKLRDWRKRGSVGLATKRKVESSFELLGRRDRLADEAGPLEVNLN